MANNRLAFGLCKEYGIELPKDATPTDAWKALEDKGITQDEAFQKASKSYKQGANYDDIIKVDSDYTNKEVNTIADFAGTILGYGDDDNYSKWQENSPNDTLKKLKEEGYEPVIQNGQIKRFKYTEEKLAQIKKEEEKENDKFSSILDKKEITQEDYEYLRSHNPKPRNSALTKYAQGFYDMSKRFAKEKANQDNFFENSVGIWEKKKVPQREPDYQSTNSRTGETSSEYWYTDEGVYRRSNHWGSGVASCDWYIEGQQAATKNIFTRTFDVGEKEEAFIKWKDLYPKGEIKIDPKTNKYEPKGFVFDKNWEYNERT